MGDRSMTNGRNNTKIAIIVRSDKAESVYPAFILATTAASMGIKSEIFFTFWGLKAVIKGGPEEIEQEFRKQLSNQGKSFKGIPSLIDLINIARSSDNIQLYACSTTIEAMGITKEMLLDNIEIVGAATFLSKHGGANSKVIVF